MGTYFSRQRMIAAPSAPAASTRCRQTLATTTMENSFQTLSGADLTQLADQEIAALSRTELVRLVMRSKAIVTAVATLCSDDNNTVEHRP